MQEIAEVKPNVKKLCILSSIQIIIVAAVIIGLAIFLDRMVNFNQIFEVFTEFGAPPMQSSIFLRWFIIIGVAITLIVLIINYLTLGKVRYVFYEDKLVCYNNFMIMQISEVEIPYANITTVGVETKHTAKNADIKIDLTGMKKKNIILEFIDNAQEVSAGIQNIINNWKANYYAQYAQEYRLKNIAEGSY